MLQTRLWMGTLLVLFAVGLLVVDAYLEPWYPFLLLTTLLAVGLAAHELIAILPAPGVRPWVCQAALAAIILANWPAHLFELGDAWHWIIAALVLTLIAMFLVEALHFQEPSGAVVRLALGFWVVGYLGWLACFFVQIRWLPEGLGTLGLALAIFVPKCGDIGAYSMGRALGRHRLAPILSPKKTWEGAAGGLLASLAIALAINYLGVYLIPRQQPLLPWWSAAGFGLAVGGLAMLGDLMESLIKRDCGRKDTSALVPGFGGVLDVLDSIVFSAPLAYFWLVASQ